MIESKVFEDRLFAIDIALFFNEDDNKELWKYNEAVYEKAEIAFLFEQNKIPHITFYQAIVVESEIPKIVKLLDTTDFYNLDKKINVESDVKIENANYCDLFVHSLSLSGERELFLDFHSSFVTGIQNYDLDCENSYYSSFYYRPEEVSKKTYLWTLDFLRNNSMESFNPHLTLAVSSLGVNPGYLFTSSYLIPKGVSLSIMGECCTVTKKTFWELNF